MLAKAFCSPKFIPTNAKYERFRPCRAVIPSEDYDSKQSYEWRDVIDKAGFEAAPPDSFAHAPLANVWAHICPGIKLEVINPDYVANTKDGTDSVYWYASIISVSGYRVLLRYEGYGSESSHDIWMNLCSLDIHYVGWSAANCKLLAPPRAIADKISDWKSFMIKRLIGCRTLPMDFENLVKYSLQCRFGFGTLLEATDRDHMDRVRPAVVKEVIAQRLRVVYVESESAAGKEIDRKDDSSEENGFWCSASSPLLHPVGWALKIGHTIRCSAEYKKQCMENLKECYLNMMPSQQSSVTKDWNGTKEMSPNTMQTKTEPSTLEMFDFQVNMKLEAVDPSDLGRITVATVSKVLKDRYMMIKFDGTSDSFCYHRTSPFIFPPGFCEANNIELTPPKDYKGAFSWEEYLKETKSLGAPSALFSLNPSAHKFKVGQKIEAADLVESHLVCPATIAEIKGRLLKIRFDGWDETYDQWTDYQSSDIYPVGWCEMAGYHLEIPKCIPQHNQKSHGKAASCKNSSEVNSKRRKLSSVTSNNATMSDGTEEMEQSPVSDVTN